MALLEHPLPMSRSPTAEALLHPFFHLLEQACHDGRQPLVPSSTRDVAALDEHEVRRQRTRTIRLIESPLRPDVPRSCTVFRGFKWLIRAQGDPSFMLARTAQSPVRGMHQACRVCRDGSLGLTVSADHARGKACFMALLRPLLVGSLTLPQLATRQSTASLLPPPPSRDLMSGTSR